MTTALIADKVGLLFDGKRDITGACVEITTVELPVVWDNVHFLFRIDASADQEDCQLITTIDMRLGLRSARFGPFLGSFNRELGPDGTDLIYVVPEVIFRDFGTYYFEIRINGEHLGSIPLWITEDAK
jgi:hypothetical protein